MPPLALTLTAALAALAGCSSTPSTQCAPTSTSTTAAITSEEPAGPRPVLGDADTRFVATTVETIVRAKVQPVFDFTVAEDVLPKVLKSYGPIPKVTGTQVLNGPWERVGANRRVLIEGGATTFEQITLYDRPHLYTYQISDFRGNQLPSFAAFANGRFEFTEIDSSTTKIKWTYSFAVKSGATHPILSTFVCLFYSGFMKQALEEIRVQVEADVAQKR